MTSIGILGTVRSSGLARRAAVVALSLIAGWIGLAKPAMGATAGGSYVGNGLDNRSILGCGFNPDMVIVHSVQGREPMVRIDEMGSGFSRSLSDDDGLESNVIQNLINDGFEVGTDDRVNRPGETYIWIAFSEVAGRMTTGSYIGSGLDNRSVAGLGFEPSYVMVFSAASDDAWHRPSGISGDASLSFGTRSPAGDRIQALESNGFQVGGHGEVNRLLTTYYYAAWKRGDRVFHSGRYTGDGVDGRASTGVTFGPTYLLIANEADHGAIHRSTDLGLGDASLPLDDSGFVSDGIQAFISGGFEVGTRDEVNRFGDTYHWMAWNSRDETLDAAVNVSVDDPTPGVGDTLSVTVDLVNTGPSAATGVTVVHLLPPELEHVSYVSSRGKYIPSNGKWGLDSVLVGVPEQLTIRARVGDGSAEASVRDSVLIASIDQIDTDATNDSAGVGIQIGLLDLSVSLGVDAATPDVGDTITFTATVENHGAGDATGIEVSLPLPSGLGYVANTPSQGSYDDGTGTWTVGGVLDGATATLSLSALVEVGSGGDSLTVTSVISEQDQGDADPTDNSDSAVVVPTAVDVGVNISVDDATPAEGDTLRFTLTATNAGPDGASAVTIEAPLPAGLTFDGAVGTGSYDIDTGLWTLGSVPASTGTFLTLQATVDPGTSGSTLVQPIQFVSATEEDVNPANDADSISVAVHAVDLALSSSVSDATPDEGRPTLLTYRVQNLGPDDASGISVNALLPPTVTLDSHALSQGTYDDGTGDWAVGALDDGDEAALLLSVLPGDGTSGSTIDLAAFLTQSTPVDYTTANDTTEVSLQVTAADLSVSLDVTPPAPAGGDTVAVTLRLTNQGPDDATGVALDLFLPAEMTETGAAAAIGTYAEGVWDVGALASGDVDSLVVTVTIDPAASGLILAVDARVDDLDQGDPDPSDDRDRVFVPVGDVPDTDVDLALSATVTDSTPDEGTPVLLTYRVQNLGPDNAAGVSIGTLLPGALVLDSFGVSRGSYDDDLGTWAVGTLDQGEEASLLLSVRPGPGTSGTVIDTEASLIVSTPLDISAVNDTARVSLDVTSADLAVSLAVEPPTPDAGDTVTVTVSLVNLGPDPSTGVVAHLLLPSKLETISATPEVGSYDEGEWDLGALPVTDTVTLVVTARVAPAASGLVLPLEARIADADQGDPDTGNNRHLIYLPVGDAAEAALEASLVTVGESVLRPGVGDRHLLRVRVMNPGVAVQTLRSVTVSNASSGAGALDQLDESFLPFTLWRLDDGSLVPPATLADTPLASSFAGGSLSIVGLDEPLAPADTLDLVLTGGASLTARDGDLLAISLAGGTSMGFEGDPPLAADFPLVTPGRAVDGMTAAQLSLSDVDAGVFLTGSHQNLALRVRVPGNGYVADTLERLNVINTGTAEAGPDLLRLEAWVDVDADDALDPAVDRALGTFSFTGDRWELTGLAEAVPVAGLPIFVSVDIADGARDGRTVSLGLPTGADVGVGMASNNDGPLDADVVNAFSQIIGLSDRIVVTLADRAPFAVHPGEGAVEALHLVTTNTYVEDRVLTSITLTNRSASISGGDADDLDRAISQVAIHADANGNGVLDGPLTDPILQTSVFVDGRATLGGLGYALPAGERRDLFVTFDVATRDATDGDTLALSIDDEAELRFDLSSAVLAAWPLASNQHPVDGMVAGQLQLGSITPSALAPGDGPVLALDLVVPSNGYAVDILEGLILRNLGTAGPADLAALALHRDDGDGEFDADLDPHLGDLFYDGGASLWRSPSLSESIPTEGIHLFAAITVATAPSDSASVRLSVPLNAITVASSNDGPVDEAVSVTTDLVISTSPLLASLAVERPQSVLGQSVAVSMTVRNVSDTTVVDIVPSTLTVTGTGDVVLASGPSPPTFDLGSGASGTFTWTFDAATVGEVRFRGDAQGTAPGGTRRALPTETDIHRLLRAATSIEVFPVATMPFSIVRGQEGVVPLTLTLANAGDVWTSDAALTRLRVRIEDGSSAPVAAEDLLSRFQLREGADTYLDVTSFSSVDGYLELPLDRTVFVTQSEPVSLGLRIDLLPTTLVPAFRLVLVDSTALGAEEAITGVGISVLHPDGAFPVTSGLGNVLEAADGLLVQRNALPDRFAGQGQASVPLLDLEGWNVGIDDISSTVLLSSFTFRLQDEDGQTVTSPDGILTSFFTRTPQADTPLTEVTLDSGPVLTQTFSPPLEIEVNRVVPIELVGDLAEDATLGGFRIAIEASGFVAADATTGDAVEITVNEEPDEGMVVVEAPADTITIAPSAILPATSPIGARELPAVVLRFRHPGVVGTAPVSVDTLWVTCLDERRDPVEPDPVLDVVRILRGPEILASVSDPDGDAGRFAIPLTDVTLVAGQTDTLTLLVDLEASAPRSSLELVIDADDVVAVDVNRGHRVTVVAAAGTSLPATSGLTRLEPPADRIEVAFEEALPAVLGPSPLPLPVGTIIVRNPALATVGDVVVEGIDLRATDAEGESILTGSLVAEITLTVDDVVVGTTTLLADDVLAEVRPDSLLYLPAGSEIELLIDATFRDGAGASLRLGFEEADVHVTQPGGALLAIRIDPVAGETFPFWTDVGHFTRLDLESSYANFPNPFAAGREATTFVYALDGAARVSLRLLTARGDGVRTILDGTPRPAGIHQADRWDGRNGRGLAVRSGVYVAELDVRYEDGRHARILRKVAVVR